jgi:excisionase family DNA binding protein
VRRRQIEQLGPREVDGPVIPPRAISVREAAKALGVSYWTCRDWVIAGLLPVVELPGLRPREGARAKKTLRRVVIAVEDLDRFIREHRKAAGSIA